ncbi:hypothetical protein ACHAWF_018980 [Thalassiosira exigua]
MKSGLTGNCGRLPSQVTQGQRDVHDETENNPPPASDTMPGRSEQQLSGADLGTIAGIGAAGKTAASRDVPSTKTKGTEGGAPEKAAASEGSGDTVVHNGIPSTPNAKGVDLKNGGSAMLSAPPTLKKKSTRSDVTWGSNTKAEYDKSLGAANNLFVDIVTTFGDGVQLGRGESVIKARKPRVVSSLIGRDICAVTSGGYHSLALDRTGQVYSWGADEDGSLGRRTTEGNLLPDRIKKGILPSQYGPNGVTKDMRDANGELLPFEERPEAVITQIAAGETQSLALSTAGDVYFWGIYRDGEGRKFRNMPPKDDTRLATGNKDMDSLEDHDDPIYYYPPRGNQDWPLHLAQIPRQATAISAGGAFNAVLLVDGSLVTFGVGNSCGELARSTPKFDRETSDADVKEHFLTPKPPMWDQPLLKRNVQSLSCGAFHLLVITKENGGRSVYSSGLNKDGQLGLGDEENREVLTKIPALEGKNIATVEGGEFFSCFVGASGRELYAAGGGDYGQLGITLAQPEVGYFEKTPCRVPLVYEPKGPVAKPGENCIVAEDIVEADQPEIEQISCGSSHVLVLTKDGAAYSWGFGESGACGQGKEKADIFRPKKLEAKVKGEPCQMRCISGGGQHSAVIVRTSKVSVAEVDDLSSKAKVAFDALSTGSNQIATSDFEKLTASMETSCENRSRTIRIISTVDEATGKSVITREAAIGWSLDKTFRGSESDDESDDEEHEIKQARYAGRNLREVLFSFYRQHNPEKLKASGFIDNLATKYAGAGNALFMKLSKLYENVDQLDFVFQQPTGGFGDNTQSVTTVPSPLLSSGGAPVLGKVANSGWGDLFKKQPGEWNCAACRGPNPPSATKCLSCDAPKPGGGGGAAESTSASNGSKASGSIGEGGFSFGVATAANTTFAFGTGVASSSAPAPAKPPTPSGAGFVFRTPGGATPAVGGFGSTPAPAPAGGCFSFGNTHKTLAATTPASCGAASTNAPAAHSTGGVGATPTPAAAGGFGGFSSNSSPGDMIQESPDGIPSSKRGRSLLEKEGSPSSTPARKKAKTVNEQQRDAIVANGEAGAKSTCPARAASSRDAQSTGTEDPAVTIATNPVDPSSSEGAKLEETQRPSQSSTSGPTEKSASVEGDKENDAANTDPSSNKQESCETEQPKTPVPSKSSTRRESTQANEHEVQSLIDDNDNRAETPAKPAPAAAAGGGDASKALATNAARAEADPAGKGQGAAPRNVERRLGKGRHVTLNLGPTARLPIRGTRRTTPRTSPRRTPTNERTTSAGGRNAVSPVTMELFTMHVTQKEASGGDRLSLDAARWDFSHLPGTATKLLKEHPLSDIYLYAATEEVDGCEAQYIVATVVPKGHTPTQMVAQHDGSKVTPRPFGDIGYSWAKARSEALEGRVYFLACDIDDAHIPSGLHRNSDIFFLTRGDLERGRDGTLRVDAVSYTVKTSENEVENVTWIPGEEKMRNHVQSVMTQYYNVDTDTNSKATQQVRMHVMEEVKSGLKQARTEKQQQIDSYMEAAKTTEVAFKTFKLVKIVPVNFQGQITGRLSNKMHDAIGVQSEHVVSDHYYLAPRLVENLSRGLLVNGAPQSLQTFDYLQWTASPVIERLNMILVVEFLDRTGYLGEIDCKQIIATFGAERVLQHFGLSLSEMTSDEGVGEGMVRKYLIELTRKLGSIFEQNGRPSDALNFFVAVLPFKSPDLEANRQIEPLDKERAAGYLCFDEEDEMLKIIYHNDESGARHPIEPKDIGIFVKPEEILPLNLVVLSRKTTHVAKIGAGARDDGDPVADEERSDCWKQALLHLPCLDPAAKQRVQDHIPDCRLTFGKIYGIIQQHVRTIVLKKVTENVHDTAMTAKEVMIGEFACGPYTHCVVIDGHRDVIIDPALHPKEFKRRSRDMKRRGAEEFTTLYIVTKRVLNYSLDDSKPLTKGQKRRLRMKRMKARRGEEAKKEEEAKQEEAKQEEEAKQAAVE